jgi:hypothetical protein
MATEDALVLARSLRTANSISSAFTAYEHERRDRVERVVTQGERNGNQKSQARWRACRATMSSSRSGCALPSAWRTHNGCSTITSSGDLESGLERVEGLGQRGNGFDRALD